MGSQERYLKFKTQNFLQLYFIIFQLDSQLLALSSKNILQVRYF
jgi:hypothetical protein